MSVLQGWLSGLFFGAGGSVLDTAINGRRTAEGTMPTQKVYEGADGSTYLAPERDLVYQYVNRPKRNTTINFSISSPNIFNWNWVFCCFYSTHYMLKLIVLFS